jgi:hypothetical protein
VETDHTHAKTQCAETWDQIPCVPWRCYRPGWKGSNPAAKGLGRFRSWWPNRHQPPYDGQPARRKPAASPPITDTRRAGRQRAIGLGTDRSGKRVAVHGRMGARHRSRSRMNQHRRPGKKENEFSPLARKKGQYPCFQNARHLLSFLRRVNARLMDANGDTHYRGNGDGSGNPPAFLSAELFFIF